MKNVLKAVAAVSISAVTNLYSSNIEIKAHYENLDQAREIALSLGAKHAGNERQVDTYFATQNGRLKLRESSLHGVTLVPYIRPDQQGPKKCDYSLIKIEPAEVNHVKDLLTQTLGLDIVIDKIREVYLIGNVRVHLDKVIDLGTFFELEAVYHDDTPEALERETTKIKELIEKFQITKEDLIKDSYRELLKAKL